MYNWTNKKGKKIETYLNVNFDYVSHGCKYIIIRDGKYDDNELKKLVEDAVNRYVYVFFENTAKNKNNEEYKYYFYWSWEITYRTIKQYDEKYHCVINRSELNTTINKNYEELKQEIENSYKECIMAKYE